MLLTIHGSRKSALAAASARNPAKRRRFLVATSSAPDDAIRRQILEHRIPAYRHRSHEKGLPESRRRAVAASSPFSLLLSSSSVRSHIGTSGSERSLTRRVRTQGTIGADRLSSNCKRLVRGREQSGQIEWQPRTLPVPQRRSLRNRSRPSSVL